MNADDKREDEGAEEQAADPNEPVQPPSGDDPEKGEFPILPENPSAPVPF
jgi:hypothetical protein